MRREKVIVKELRINKRGQRQFFEVKIPRDCNRIIGFETSVKGVDLFNFHHHFFFDLFYFQPIYPAGELKIQSCGSSNQCYKTEVVLSDINLGYGDFSIPFFDIIHDYPWKHSQWTHSRKREEDEISVNEDCPVLYGNYKDIIGEIWNGDIPYQVSIYVWYESKKIKQ